MAVGLGAWSLVRLPVEYVALRRAGDELLLERAAPLSAVRVLPEQVAEVRAVRSDYQADGEHVDHLVIEFQLTDGSLVRQCGYWDEHQERVASEMVEEWLSRPLSYYRRTSPRGRPEPVGLEG